LKGKIALGYNYEGKYFNISSCHAEMNVINKIKCNKNNPIKMDILIVRINNNGEIKNSKPCKNCIKYIEKSRLNFVNVYYSNEKSQIIKTNLKLLSMDICQHISSGMRRKKTI